MRSRIPLVLAGFLIVALIATVGLAAFTPSGSPSAADPAEVEAIDMDFPISGRVASAVLALAVAPVRDADLATSTTVVVAETAPDSRAESETTAAPSTTVTTDTVVAQQDDQSST
ncbi:MAG TPA: hypothetical protein VFD97_08630, partial [Acidimicrobiia bacterium]|nr:hypothetical protein [Acidimicrobiia bacterium]